MITTVVYTSNTGETEKYAIAFAEMVHLPCMDLKHSSDYAEGTSVLYFGWVFADHIQGYEKAQQRFHIPCVCGVGMSTAGTKDETIREAMKLDDNTVLFTLQGGLHMKQLKGMHKLILSVVRKSSISSLESRQRTPQEEDDLLLWKEGGSRFDPSALTPIVSWYEQYQAGVM